MKKMIQTVLSLLLVLALSNQSYSQLANGKSKFLGNIIASSAPSNFSTYWNQVTPENSSKWGSVEGTRDVMNWSQLDVAYNYATSRGYNFKFHTLVWGAQSPGWLTSLSQADQRAEIEEWMQAAATRYPNIWAIDVVNEPVKTAIAWKNALGGNGSTGWDWVITSFQLARQYFPGKKLLINEYGTENDVNARNQMKTIINLLKSRGLIDGIGIQAHAFNLDGMSASQMTTCLNDYATLGLDIFISELDIRGQGSTINETAQRNKYQELFPVMWNHASVKGITLWGYIEGQTWMTNSGILNSNGTERLAMQWLKTFMGGGGGPNTIVVRARGTNGSESIQLRVNNTTIATWTLTTSMANYTATTSSTGGITVNFTNDASGRDVQVDYIQVNGSTRQAESQATNTGVWQNSRCGGSNSEWMHCNGYIGFGNVPKEGADFEEQIIEVLPTEFTLKQNYPNPFNPLTNIDYSIAEASYVRLTVYDLVGREVKTLVNETQSAGYHTAQFNAENIPSGVYFYRLEANGRSFTNKMILMK